MIDPGSVALIVGALTGLIGAVATAAVKILSALNRGSHKLDSIGVQVNGNAAALQTKIEQLQLQLNGLEALVRSQQETIAGLQATKLLLSGVVEHLQNVLPDKL